MGEENVDVRFLEADVNGADDSEDAESIAEDAKDGDEAVGEGAGEPVGRKVEPPLVVHHSLWAEMENMEVSSLAVRRGRRNDRRRRRGRHVRPAGWYTQNTRVSRQERNSAKPSGQASLPQHQPPAAYGSPDAPINARVIGSQRACSMPPCRRRGARDSLAQTRLIAQRSAQDIDRRCYPRSCTAENLNPITSTPHLRQSCKFI